MKKNVLEKILLFSVTMVMCFLLLEVGLRITGHRAFKISEGEHTQHKDSFRLRKNASTFHDWSTSTFTVNTNSFGYRDRNVGERDMGNRPYVVFIGDSQVFGLGVDYEESFVGIFADSAAERGIEVLNLAVGGHYPLEQEEMFRDMLEIQPRKPSMVILTFNPRSLNWFDRIRHPVKVKSGYLFDAKTWKSAYVRMMLQNNLSIYVFFRDAFWSLHRSWAGTAEQTGLPKYFDLYSRKSRLYDAEIVKQLEDHLDSFQSYCDEQGIRTVFLYVPICDSFTVKDTVTRLGYDPDEYDVLVYDRFLEDYCARRGHLCINPKPVLKEYDDQGKDMDFGKDPHYNEFSNRIVGEYLAEKVFVENELF